MLIIIKNIKKKNGMNSSKNVLNGKKMLYIKEKRMKYIDIKEINKLIINLL
jgi:hypothetical protein